MYGARLKAERSAQYFQLRRPPHLLHRGGLVLHLRRFTVDSKSPLKEARQRLTTH